MSCSVEQSEGPACGEHPLAFDDRLVRASDDTRAEELAVEGVARFADLLRRLGEQPAD